MDFSEELKAIRKKYNITQNDLALEIGVSFSTINRIENGVTIANNKTIYAFKNFCEKHNYTIDDSNISRGLTLVTASLLSTAISSDKKKWEINFVKLVESSLIELDKNNFSEIDFLQGDLTNRPGYDGITVYNGTNKFIPKGRAYWEIGTSRDIKGKIKKDFGKRKNNLAESDTLVLATPFCIKDKKKLIDSLKEEVNCNILIYSDEDWELILSNCFNTSIWFLETFTNKKLSGVTTVNSKWNEVKQLTEPESTFSLYTNGRENLIQRILNCDKKIIKVSGYSSFDTINFIIVTMSMHSDSIKNAIYINNLDSFNSIKKYVNNTWIIANFQEEICDTNGTNKIIRIVSSYETKYDFYVGVRDSFQISETLKNDMHVDIDKVRINSLSLKNIVFQLNNGSMNHEFRYSSNEKKAMLYAILFYKLPFTDAFFRERDNGDLIKGILHDICKRTDSPITENNEQFIVLDRFDLWENVRDVLNEDHFNFLCNAIKDELSKKYKNHEKIKYLMESLILFSRTVYYSDTNNFISELLHNYDVLEYSFALIEASPQTYLDYLNDNIKDITSNNVNIVIYALDRLQQSFYYGNKARLLLIKIYLEKNQGAINHCLLESLSPLFHSFNEKIKFLILMIKKYNNKIYPLVFKIMEINSAIVNDNYIFYKFYDRNYLNKLTYEEIYQGYHSLLVTMAEDKDYDFQHDFIIYLSQGELIDKTQEDFICDYLFLADLDGLSIKRIVSLKNNEKHKCYDSFNKLYKYCSKKYPLELSILTFDDDHEWLSISEEKINKKKAKVFTNLKNNNFDDLIRLFPVLINDAGYNFSFLDLVSFSKKELEMFANCLLSSKHYSILRTLLLAVDNKKASTYIASLNDKNKELLITYVNLPYHLYDADTLNKFTKEIFSNYLLASESTEYEITNVITYNPLEYLLYIYPNYATTNKENTIKCLNNITTFNYNDFYIADALQQLDTEIDNEIYNLEMKFVYNINFDFKSKNISLHLFNNPEELSELINNDSLKAKQLLKLIDFKNADYYDDIIGFINYYRDDEYALYTIGRSLAYDLNKYEKLPPLLKQMIINIDDKNFTEGISNELASISFSSSTNFDEAIKTLEEDSDNNLNRHLFYISKQRIDNFIEIRNKQYDRVR